MTALFDAGPAARAVLRSTILVRGAFFCVSDDFGRIDPARPQGLFHADRRIISLLRLTLDGQEPEVIATRGEGPDRSVALAREPLVEAGLLVRAERHLHDSALDITLTLTNPSHAEREIDVRWQIAADFADIFTVKEGRPIVSAATSAVATGSTLHLASDGARVEISCPPLLSDVTGLRGLVRLGPGAERQVRLSAAPPTGRTHLPLWRSGPRGRTHVTTTGGPRGLTGAVTRGQYDVDSLRLGAPEGGVTVAAGAPWFMTLFGRDSLWAGMMCLPWDPALLRDTLRILARHQGRASDPVTEEQPGRILHEIRLDADRGLFRGDGHAYFGTVDATPLFVVALGEYARWTADRATVTDLLPHADAALRWMTRFGDTDGDGFIDYPGRPGGGLRNQGWKDSWDAVPDAAGLPAAGPIALVEVQAYAYAAWVARAHLARWLGEDPTEAIGAAVDLASRFDTAYWSDEIDCYALALDGDGRHVDVVSSNAAHALWAGIVPAHRHAALTRRIMSPDLVDGWGLRTVASSMRAFQPMSYHNGSVWPHDTAIAVHGLMRCNAPAGATELAGTLLSAAAAADGRLPELLSGLPRTAFPQPIPYPAACMPQAWSAAAPLQLLRALLGLEVDGVREVLRWRPTRGITAHGLSICGHDVHIDGGEIFGLPDHWCIVDDGDDAVHPWSVGL